MAQRVPEYALGPLKRFVEYWESSTQLLNISIQGISMLRGIPKLSMTVGEAIKLAEPETWDEEAHQSLLRMASERALFAEKEISAGFPLLHELTLVGTWGALEAAVEDLVVALLVNEPELLQMPVFSKVKIPLADYEVLEKEDRMRYLVTELQRTYPLSQKQGIGGFESLLDCVGLSGEVEDNRRKIFWEMNHLRNVIVHRQSCADRNLLKACPWMEVPVGQRISIAHEKMADYGGALCTYATDIIYRLKTRYDARKGGGRVAEASA